MKRGGIYIHVPFCAKKCFYCDFYSCEYEDLLADRYLSALRCQIEGLDCFEISSVYFGGGTPSLLSADSIARVLEALCRRGRMLPSAEITLEVNPEDASLQKMSRWRKAGVNRLSVGAQTQRDSTLRAIGRRHTAARTVEVLCAAQDAGFDNVSADIILGLPGEDLRTVDATLTELLALPLTHLSAYLLKLAPGTPMGDRVPKNIADDDTQAEWYTRCVEHLGGAGFDQYEISNFSKPGYQSRHNLLYWNCENYAGLGPAAHSSLQGKRYSFSGGLRAYLETYRSRVIPFTEPLSFEGEVTAEDYIMLQLRRTEGLSLDNLYRLYHFSFDNSRLDFLRSCCREGLACLSEGRVSLTVRGMLISNSILASLL